MKIAATICVTMNMTIGCDLAQSITKHSNSDQLTLCALLHTQCAGIATQSYYKLITLSKTAKTSLFIESVCSDLEG